MRLLRVLLIEDSEDDAELVLRALRKGGYDPASRRVDTPEELEHALRSDWDCAISDFNMPRMSALEALAKVRAASPDLPFLVVSGAVGEEKAVQLMREGAQDFVPKGRLGRLAPALERELREAEMRRARHEVERERVVLLRELEQALRARDEFILIASHELRTPITSLKLQAQMLERAASPEAQRRLAAVCSRQIDRLGRLVEDMLDVARVGERALRPQGSAEDLSEIVGGALRRLAPAVAEAECPLTVRLEPGLRGAWDRSRIEQVMVNVIGNAVKYGRGRPISVSAGRAGDYAEVRVTDEGMGIDKENQERIFGRFERAVPATSISGLGVGLYIARRILESHRGQIAVESERGRGATFIITLPLGEPAARASEPVRSAG